MAVDKIVGKLCKIPLKNWKRKDIWVYTCHYKIFYKLTFEKNVESSSSADPDWGDGDSRWYTYALKINHKAKIIFDGEFSERDNIKNYFIKLEQYFDKKESKERRIKEKRQKNSLNKFLEN